MESLFGAWHRIGTNTNNAYYYTLLETEKTNQTISSIPQNHQHVYFNSKLTKQPYGSHSIFLVNLLFGRTHPE